MNLEIERKFLVKNNSFIQESYKKHYIKQGYLNSNKNRTVRIRIRDNKSYITVKGVSNSSGTTRFEWEKEIPLKEGQQLFLLCEEAIIEKYRYLVKTKNHIYEVDQFLGENKGLTVAEIELDSEKDFFEKPDWIGEEVTGQISYYNSSLSKIPYNKWS